MAAEALEQSVLESKDKDQLLAIAKALGVKASARTKKSDIIGQILESTGGSVAVVATPTPSPPPLASSSSQSSTSSTSNGDAAPVSQAVGSNGDSRPTAPASSQAPELFDEPPAEWELAAGGDEARREVEAPAAVEAAGSVDAAPADDEVTEAANDGLVSTPTASGAATTDRQDRPDRQDRQQGRQQGGGDRQAGRQGEVRSNDRNADQGDDGEGRNRRRRRRRKGGGRGVDGPQGDDAGLVETIEPAGAEPLGNEPVEISGYLDMRDEGYGFLRVNGYLASKDDAYIPVKLARQYGLRKGDEIVGMSRPAGRNEKNPALLDVRTVNGADPEEARRRPRFEDLTALFPDERLRLENPADPTNMTARIIDLVAPIGKGQRGIIVSPPKAGKTFVMKTIATSIEHNNPEVKLIVLLIDERPEEVTDIRRTVKGEVISSTFDRPSDEHTHVAELAIEKAKRLVEQGEDVVVILDGITRLSRAYNLAAPASGRILSGGIDAGALYPPKKFFGAARNVEEGGSLTILATALVDTNSRMDEAIFEEFKGTGNMELRLDRKLSERRIYPAIDVDASSTRHEELLFDRKQLQMVWKLRRVLSGLAADGNAAPGLELLMDRLKTFRTNDEFLNEIAKQPSM
ncbi:MAG: transcription termination factor Rho [Ilumatobacteraceae bacterium]